jgi:hypothetical protein
MPLSHVVTTCKQRNQLLKEWNQAVLNFSKSVSRLNACHGDGRKFRDQHRATELARLDAENARMILELHRTEHGC